MMELWLPTRCRISERYLLISAMRRGRLGIRGKEGIIEIFALEQVTILAGGDNILRKVLPPFGKGN